MEFSAIHLIKLARIVLKGKSKDEPIGLIDAKILYEQWMNAISGEINDKDKSANWLSEEFVRFLLMIRDGEITYTENHNFFWNLENPEVTYEDMVNIATQNGKSRALHYNKKGE